MSLFTIASEEVVSVDLTSSDRKKGAGVGPRAITPPAFRIWLRHSAIQTLPFSSLLVPLPFSIATLCSGSYCFIMTV